MTRLPILKTIRGSVMMEAAIAVALMFSSAVFLAHAYDALHTR